MGVVLVWGMGRSAQFAHLSVDEFALVPCEQARQPGEGALDAAAELCRQAGLSDVRIVHDLTDRPRIVRAIVTEPKQRI